MLCALRRRLTFANVVACICLFAVLGGGAFAASSVIGSDGQLHGCVGKKSGVLRVIAAGKKCGKREIAVSWNQRGPTGKNGTPGSAGQPGAPGRDGTNGMDGTNGTNGTDGTNGARGPSNGFFTLGGGGSPGTNGLPVPVGSLALPAGKFIVTFVIEIRSADTRHGANGSCDLRGTGYSFTLPPATAANPLQITDVTASYPITLSAPGSVPVSCQQDGDNTALSTGPPQIFAVQVERLTTSGFGSG